MPLQYRTRGESIPQRKPRVFFCCHPADHDRYFPAIAEEILALQNCALYYYDQAPVDAADRALELQQMQLFVMPVTTRLLTTENSGLEDFRFALDHHIPVLPLMQESGLEEVFNRVCGDLQFLDKFHQDPTAIPYSQKLETYLSSVLVGDKLAARIRSAFDGYIFLSYRKKDRRHAQELMHLIHQNDFCRDVAIWYDEFLTPGENFNHAIQAALDKCGLFVLVVTPNLINEPNYIMQVEYPLAKEAGKPVLPLEMVPTDAAALRAVYDGIPDTTNAADAAALRKALQGAAEALSLGENEADPEHNYYIGLAYLSGVDVEVDHQRALALLTFAAENGISPASKKLVSMYLSGEGVTRNYRTAMEWQKKLVQTLHQQYIENPHRYYQGRVLEEMLELGHLAADIRDYEAASQAYLAAKSTAERITDIDTQQNLIYCYHALGKLALDQGDLDKASEYYTMSIHALPGLRNQINFSSTRRLPLVIYIQLGNIRLQQGQADSAQTYYEKALEVAEDLAAKNSYPAAQQSANRDLCNCYDRLALLFQQQGKPEIAKSFFEKELDIFAALVSEHGLPHDRYNLSICYSHLSNVWKDLGDLAQALAFQQKALEVMTALAADTEKYSVLQSLSEGYASAGQILADMGKPAEAKPYLEKSLALALDLAEQANTVGIRRNLCHIYFRFGLILQKLGDHLGARDFYRKRLALQEGLAAETSTIGEQQDLAAAYINLGILEQDLGQLAPARVYFEKALRILEALAAESDLMQIHQSVSQCCICLSDVYYRQNKPASALAYGEKALTFARKLMTQANTLDHRRTVALCHQRLGMIHRLAGNIHSAIEHYTKELELRRINTAESGALEDRRGLLTCLLGLSGVYGAQLEPKGAQKLLEEAAAIAESINDELHTLQSRQDLFTVYSRLGDILVFQKEPEEIFHHYWKCCKLAESLAQELNTPESRHNLATIYFRVGISGGKGDRVYMEKALEIWEALAQEFPEVSAYTQSRDMVKNYLDPWARIKMIAQGLMNVIRNRHTDK